MSTSPHKTLRYKLTVLRDNIEQRQQHRRNERLQRVKAEQVVQHESLPLSASCQAFFKHIALQVKQDQNRLHQLSAAAPTEAISIPPAEPAPAVALPVADPFMASLLERWQNCQGLIPEPWGGRELPSSAHPHVMAFLQQEYELLVAQNTQKGGVPAVLMMKLRLALQAYQEGRLTDTITLFKNALNADPHNHTLLACLSQVLYGMAAMGTHTALPEARDAAQRSTNANDNHQPPRLNIYRYLAAVTERGFSTERTLEWLRQGGLLNPAMMQGKQGIMAHNSIPLRAWALLATLPPETWLDHELAAMETLVTQVIGGAALYVSLLRPPILVTLSTSKLPPPDIFEKIERVLQQSAAEHSIISGALMQFPLKTTPNPWLLRVRWLNMLAQLGGVPAFDQVLCHISLDTEHWRDGDFPDRELNALTGEDSISSWRIWAQSITPSKDIRKTYLLPSEETLQDSALLMDCEQCLALLKAAEAERVKPQLWQELKPWLVRWQLEHLLAVATGSNQPRNRFAPSLSPYTQFYRHWQEPTVTALLTSELIAETARRGGFASLFEVQAAFDGALRLLDDPVHGLQATQKRAYAAAMKHNPLKFGKLKADFGGAQAKVGLWVAPLGLCGAVAAAVTLSSNASQAAGLSLALIGLAGVVMLKLKKA